ncbi:hypothetical protein Fcan01_22979 [Folsomia candida]|uniref:CRAL-TRIO domain-containing protein n=1 Tax=Folsomia candida TaxID=158441 RepID=A0A226D9Q2_FOLCA|nr:hypothetical protein Fcan01_22979 [Folsomia candida]
MDTLLDEDWTEFNNQYRFNMDGCDDKGNPNLVLFVGEWDMRRAAIAGQSDKLRRYIDKCFEEMSIMLRNMQADGANATRINLILDMASLSLQVQACPRSPDIAVPLWTNVIRPFAPPEIARIVDVYGRKKSDWREALRAKYGIDWIKLSHEMGGDGPDPVDANELRKARYSFKCPEV